MKNKRLKKDIIIPAGTIFKPASQKTERFGNTHFEHTIGLTSDTYGVLTYCIDNNELDEWFETINKN